MFGFFNNLLNKFPVDGHLRCFWIINNVLGIGLPELIYWNTVFPAQFQINSEFFSVSISHTFIPRGQGIWDSFFFCLFCFSFYWSTVDLQHCVNFCCTGKWLLYTYIYMLFYILFLYSLSQDVEYCSPCYTIEPCCLSILYVILCIY